MIVKIMLADNSFLKSSFQMLLTVEGSPHSVHI